MIFWKNVSYCYHLFIILVWRKCKLLLSSFYYISLNCERQKELFRWNKVLCTDGSLQGGAGGGGGKKVWWAVWVILSHFKKQIVLYIYIFDTFVLDLVREKETWSSFSEGLHGINRALIFIFLFFYFLGKRSASEDKTKAKTRKGKGPHFVSKTTCFVGVVFSLLFCCCSFFLFFDGPPGTAGLVTRHVYLAFGCGSTQTRTAASKSVYEDFTCWHRCRRSKVHKKCLSAFFRHQPNLRLTNARVKSDT